MLQPIPSIPSVPGQGVADASISAVDLIDLVLKQLLYDDFSTSFLDMYCLEVI